MCELDLDVQETAHSPNNENKQDLSAKPPQENV